MSWAIMWWTKKPYSHVARAIEIRDWGQRYFQASEGKVNYEHEHYFNLKHEIVKTYVIRIPKALDVKIKYECYKEAGNVYGSMQNVGIFITDILGYFGIKCKNPFKKGRNCSELIYGEVLKQMYPDLDYDSEKIKPHEVEEILISKGYSAS